ncbi:MAG TPA: hypothetical protein PLD39_02660, partial [Flexilinea sp.]|nr:hypothetical protein [Flexilinea sp.]
PPMGGFFKAAPLGCGFFTHRNTFRILRIEHLATEQRLCVRRDVKTSYKNIEKRFLCYTESK